MKLIKGLLRIAIPVVAIIVLSNIDPLLGTLGVLVVILYLIYKSKGSLLFYSASRAALKKDYETARKRLASAYDKGWFTPYQEGTYAFFLLKRFGEWEVSEKISKRVLSIPKLEEADRGLASLNLMMVNFYKGELEQAIEAADELRGKYKSTNYYASYGYFLIEAGDYEKALEINQEAYEYNKDNPVILDNLGQNYLMLDQIEKAQEIYSELMSKNPEFPEAYFNYGLLMEKLGDIDEGIYQMKKSLDFEFNYLTTIDADTIKENLERLYDIKESKKEEEETDDEEDR